MCLGSVRKLLLMGSYAYKAQELPPDVRSRIDAAIAAQMTILVAEAHGACRLFQDYLASNGYRDVVVGHARSLRYNAGGWRDVQYGQSLREREMNMILDCDSAVIIRQDESSVIAENLELLKKLGKPAYLYEYKSVDGSVNAGNLDPNRTDRLYYPWKGFYRKTRQDE